MADFDRFLELLKDNLKALAQEHLGDLRDAALRDGQAFVAATRADLERWLALVAEGALTRDDFEWLVQGKKDLAELEALKQAGLAKVRLDRFRSSLVELVVNTAFQVV